MKLQNKKVKHFTVLLTWRTWRIQEGLDRPGESGSSEIIRQLWNSGIKMFINTGLINVSCDLFQEKFGTNYNLVKFKVVWYNIWVKLELTVLFKKFVKFTRWAINKKLLKSLKGEIQKVHQPKRVASQRYFLIWQMVNNWNFKL